MNFILPVSNSINYRNLNDDLQLVSVIIVTYNSGKYVLETLESVKQQTYKKIELIVTDDHSNDDTVEICQNWLNQNNKYFVRTELITSTRNTGIAPNCNRGLKASKGLWLKFFAGDDILLENCIALFMDFVLRNPNCKVLFGKLFYLKEGVLKEEVKNKIFTQTQKKQYLTILKGSSINAPSCFHNRELLIKLGGFDEKYPFFEDAPLWIKMAENGIYFYYIDEFVVKYRLHEHQTSGFLNRKYFINKVFYYESNQKNHQHILAHQLYWLVDYDCNKNLQ